MLKGKTVILAVTGSIAAYKIASLASALKKLQADVHVLMTENATNFINPITFETLTGKTGGCGNGGTCQRQCDRKDRKRDRGRYADNDYHGMPVQEDHRSGDEYEYVHQSDCAGQPGQAPPFRV